MDKKDTDIMTPGADEQPPGTAPRPSGADEVMGHGAPRDVMGPGGAGDVMRPGAGAPGMPRLIPDQGGKVRDIMTPAPVGVYYSQTIGETARVMRDSQVGAVLVVNDGALAGLITDRDLVVRGLSEGMGPDTPVGPLCSGDLIGVAADADLGQAAQLMRENAVRRLPVINDGQVVGIVSMGDIAISADGDSALAAVSRADANI
jgi:CBS domain-containing protein